MIYLPTSFIEEGSQEIPSSRSDVYNQLQRLSRGVMLEHLQQQLTFHNQNMLFHHH